MRRAVRGDEEAAVSVFSMSSAPSGRGSRSRRRRREEAVIEVRDYLSMPSLLGLTVDGLFGRRAKAPLPRKLMLPRRGCGR